MSNKSERKIHEMILKDLQKHGYKVISDYKIQKGRVDVLAQKENFLFAIEVKNRPIETFDIIGSSTISTNLGQVPNLKRRKIVGVVTTGSAITEEAKGLAKKTGVILTEPLRLTDSIELVLKNSKGRVKARRKA